MAAPATTAPIATMLIETTWCAPLVELFEVVFAFAVGAAVVVVTGSAQFLSSSTAAHTAKSAGQDVTVFGAQTSTFPAD